MAMSADPKAVARRYFKDVWTEGQLDVIDDIMAPEVVGQDGNGPAMKGTAAIKGFVAAMRQAFPDASFTLTHQAVDGDLVATRWVCQATHQGEFRGIPATGNVVSMTGVHLHRVRDGRIVEGWANWDGIALLQQLGVLPK
jgi:steroid delta-isomerase-like uncharacterized protein